MQAKFAKSGGFAKAGPSKTNFNSNVVSKKQLDLTGFDVQMLSPDFLSGKTLKKPFKELDIHLKKTNPSGTRFSVDEDQRATKSYSKIETPSVRTEKQKQTVTFDLGSYISCEGLNIQPAKQPKTVESKNDLFGGAVNTELKAQNSIFSAILKKQLKLNNFVIAEATPQPQKIGPAETKLRAMLKKQTPTQSFVKNQAPSNQNIDEQIQQSIQDEYANESFDKISASQIKESIRESIISSDSGIKESIRESINQIKKSKESVRQEIMQSLPKSNADKSNIDQEIYEDVFEEISAEDEKQKSRTKGVLKKGKQEDKFQNSFSGSKGFRTKTSNVAKSIKFAEQLTVQKQIQSVSQFSKKIKKNDIVIQQIVQEKVSVEKLKQKIMNVLQAKPNQKSVLNNKNKQLLYNFRIQLNKLLTSQNFMSKIRKLTSFISDSPNSQNLNSVAHLQDKILNNLIQKINDLRISGVSQSQLATLKKDYDEKLSHLLKQQQIALRIEMDRKLFEKDLQLKKMIAELQQKFQSSRPFNFNQPILNKNNKIDNFEYESDQSIDSNDISWKMDLWDLLPDDQKKALYQKQGAQVTNFLTNVLMQEIKAQDLERSDISFEFPDQFNNSSDSNQNYRTEAAPKIKIKQSHPPSEYNDFAVKSNFHREQPKIQKNFSSSKLGDLPPLRGMKKQPQNSSFTSSASSYDDFDSIKMHKDTNQPRETVSSIEVVKLLSKYKQQFLKKKNDLIRKLVKILQSKEKGQQPLSSKLWALRILSTSEVSSQDEPFVKAYEQQLIMQLVSIYNRCKNRKNSAIEQQMKKMYDRLVVTCQVKTAQASIQKCNQIVPDENYITLREQKQSKQIKDVLVDYAVKFLQEQYAKQMLRIKSRRQEESKNKK